MSISLYFPAAVLQERVAKAEEVPRLVDLIHHSCAINCWLWILNRVESVSDFKVKMCVQEGASLEHQPLSLLLCVDQIWCIEWLFWRCCMTWRIVAGSFIYMSYETNVGPAENRTMLVCSRFAIVKMRIINITCGSSGPSLEVCHL